MLVFLFVVRRFGVHRGIGSGVGVQVEAAGRGRRSSVKIDRKALALSAQAAKRQPRITFYSPSAALVLNYLKNTRPRFSISDEVAGIVESELAKRYPELMASIRRLLRSQGVKGI
jgi:hypothetical protein